MVFKHSYLRNTFTGLPSFGGATPLGAPQRMRPRDQGFCRLTGTRRVWEILGRKKVIVRRGSKGGAGDLGGALEENCGPHLTAVRLNQRIVRCIVYRGSTLAAHSFPSLRRFLTLAPACWPRGKIPPHPSARSAHSSPHNGGPKRENDRREERGIWAGHSKRIVGPT